MAAKRTHLLIKTFMVETSVIPHGSLVKFGTTDDRVTLATAATDSIIGVAFVSGNPLTAQAAIGDAIEIVIYGIADVRYGGAVARGARLTANALGQAIATTATGNGLIGLATITGVLNDFGCVNISPSVL